MTAPDVPTPTPGPESAPGGQEGRARAYAEALTSSPNGPWLYINGLSIAGTFARAVMAVADSEMAPLRARVEAAEAEVERLRAGADPTMPPENAWPTAGQQWWFLLGQSEDARLGRLEQLLSWAGETFQANRRAEAAEAERDAIRQADQNLRAALTTLADEWPADEAGPFRYALRMVLDKAAALASSAPAEPEAECHECGDTICVECGYCRASNAHAESHPVPAVSGEPACNCGWGGIHDPDNPRCQRNAVSDGEGATSEAEARNLTREWMGSEVSFVWDRGHEDEAPVVGVLTQITHYDTGVSLEVAMPDRDEDGSECTVSQEWEVGLDEVVTRRPASPVVAPSATDGGGGERGPMSKTYGTRCSGR